MLELLICLSIVILLLLGVISSTQPLNRKNKQELITDEIAGAIQFAKIQALLGGSNLILTHLPNTDDWSRGMRLCRDKDILREWHWPLGNVNITWQGFQSKDYLLFSPDIGSNILNGTFTLLGNDHRKSQLIVNRLGCVRRHPVV